MDKIKSLQRKKRLGILFLQGVFKNDCKKMEDIFQDRLMSEHVPQKDAVVYDKMPAVFTGVKKWPKYTNILCNRCTREFNTFPWFEPQSVDPISIGKVGEFINPSDKKNKINRQSYSIVPKGVFCSCHCVVANIFNKTKNLAEQHNKISMLKLVYKLVTGKSIFEILPSPDPTEMVQYGGNISQAEYQKKIDDLESICNYTNKDDFSAICSAYLRKLD